jgi:hypothetical protein
MKRSIAMLLLLAAMAGNASAAADGGADYIPWTFDDFDSNCEVIENAGETPAVKVSSATVETVADEEQGELGW